MNHLIINTPLCEILFDGVSQGFHNEYTVRNIQIAVKKLKIKNKFQFKYINEKEEGDYFIEIREDGKLTRRFAKGFFSLSYDLAFKLID